MSRGKKAQIFSTDMVAAFMLLSIVMISLVSVFQVFWAQAEDFEERRDLEWIADNAMRTLIETRGDPEFWRAEILAMGLVDSSNVINEVKIKKFYSMDYETAKKKTGVRGPGYNFYFHLERAKQVVCGNGSLGLDDACNTSEECSSSYPVCCDTGAGRVCKQAGFEECSAGSFCGLGERLDECYTNADCNQDAPLCCNVTGVLRCEYEGTEGCGIGIPANKRTVLVENSPGAGVYPRNSTFVVSIEHDAIRQGEVFTAFLEVWK